MPTVTEHLTPRKRNRGESPTHDLPHRILFVDDDNDLTRIIKARLRRHRVEVTRASCGKDGLKLAHSHHPDAIITDLGMPSGDGEFLIRRLKSRPCTASIPLVVISGVTDPQRLAEVRMLGANAILRKPMKFEDLFCELGSHLAWGEPEEIDTIQAGMPDQHRRRLNSGAVLRFDAVSYNFAPRLLG